MQTTAPSQYARKRPLTVSLSPAMPSRLLVRLKDEVLSLSWPSSGWDGPAIVVISSMLSGSNEESDGPAQVETPSSAASIQGEGSYMYTIAWTAPTHSSRLDATLDALQEAIG